LPKNGWVWCESFWAHLKTTAGGFQSRRNAGLLG
jgi:hypothetical protein